MLRLIFFSITFTFFLIYRWILLIRKDIEINGKSKFKFNVNEGDF